MTQDQATQIVQRVVVHGAVEIDCPDGAARPGRHVADQEGGMPEIEFEIQRIALRGADQQR